MPAIKYFLHPNHPQTMNHYRDFVNRSARLKGKGDKTITVQLLGFICNAGAALLKDAHLAKIIATDITNGDGNPGSVWKPVPPGEYVWCVALAMKTGSYEFECYVLVDDFGWPILTGKKRYDDIPPIEEFLPVATPLVTYPLKYN